MILLGRMERDLRELGSLTPGTARAMWAAYAGYGALLTAALAHRPRTGLTVGSRTVGAVLLAGGSFLDAASIQRFSGPAQLTGTDAGDLVVGGVYSYSRNPQYTGMVAALLGLSIIRRSRPAVLLTLAMGAVLRSWVPVEERHLSQQFGKPYDRYRAGTPRWLGIPTRGLTEG